MVNLFISGILIGIANIIPGVSGGTIAVILNIYDPLISSIRHVVSHPFSSKKECLFLAQIGLGAILGILLFSHLITLSLTTFPKETMGFFIGLISVSIPFIWKSHSEMSLSVRPVLLFLGVCCALLGLVLLCEPVEMGSAVLELTMSKVGFLFLSGFIASSTMIIPGISGSFMLLILGSYYLILNSVSHVSHQLIGRDFTISSEVAVIFIVGCGAIAGIVLCSKGIFWLLRRFPKDTYYGILGLIVGSLIHMAISLVVVLNMTDLLSVFVSLIVGFSLPLLLKKR